jgi:hypothetical protein
MKEVVLALILGTLFMYESIMFIKARSYVRALYKNKTDEDDKAIRFGLGCFSTIYLITLLLGMAISHLWYGYLTLFLLSIIQTPLTQYLKRNKHWETLIGVKRLDSAISLAIIAFLFFGHFHPEILYVIYSYI